MKNIILLISVLLAVSCGKGKEAPPKTKVTKLVKELTKEDIVGAYEAKTKDGDTYKTVFLENGNLELYVNGEKIEIEHKWKITKEEKLHVTDSYGITELFRINEDGRFTLIEAIDKDGKRMDVTKELQVTYTKIK